jgi:hypothetical protein
MWQLRDPEITICTFMTKPHIRGNFIDQIGVFLNDHLLRNYSARESEFAKRATVLDAKKRI